MPTAHIYSMVEDVLSIQRVNIFSVFTATSTVAIVVLIVLLRRWNIILRKESKNNKRMEESYDDMKQYLESVLEEMKGKR
jgi:cytochrome c oxidase assembly factor CtaG